MKRLLITMALALLAASVTAQESGTKAEAKPAAPTEAQARLLRSKIIELHHRDPHLIASALKLLLSGVQGSDLAVNGDLGTITVRDFPENIATIEEAIKRLDRPAAPSQDIDLKMSVLIGANKPLESAAQIPEDLAPVIKTLRATLRYTHFALLTTIVARTKAGSYMEGSGAADPALLGPVSLKGDMITYNYHLVGITVRSSGEEHSVDIDSFSFGANVPISSGGGTLHQNLGFKTPVSIRDNQKVVIGTATAGDKALIVVVTATAGGPAPAP
ncbi:MAG TPA: secretin N-terminal domain-containing protein [Thermoanaerobaculia bacterium]|nr:secretin N-terminal domain-containing protein [Thermoanaerobaculia bacterium]